MPRIRPPELVTDPWLAHLMGCSVCAAAASWKGLCAAGRPLFEEHVPKKWQPGRWQPG